METLQFSVEDNVGWIRLARPKQHNPVDAIFREEMIQVLENIRSDLSIRAVVLAGSDGAFCAGGNLHHLKAAAGEGPFYWQQRVQNGLRMISDLIHLNRPLIAAVDGPAFGAGFALALTADMIIASPRARFSMAYLKLGLMPDLGAIYMLPRTVGLQRAKELILSTREVDVEEAHRLGIVMEIHSSEQIEARAREIAMNMTNASPIAIAQTKAGLNASLDSDQRTMFSLEACSQPAAFAAPEPIAAIDCQLNRQPTPYRWVPASSKT